MIQAISKAARRMALCALAASLAVLASNPSPANAGTDYDLRLGYYTDAEGVAVGAGLLSNVGSSNRWFFNPNVEMAFGDETNNLTLNGDFHYDFASTGNASIYLGAGPAIVHADPEFGGSDTDLGLNLFGGVTAMRGASRPFLQLKGILSDDNEVALMGGVRF